MFLFFLFVFFGHRLEKKKKTGCPPLTESIRFHHFLLCVKPNCMIEIQGKRLST